MSHFGLSCDARECCRRMPRSRGLLLPAGGDEPTGHGRVDEVGNRTEVPALSEAAAELHVLEAVGRDVEVVTSGAHRVHADARVVIDLSAGVFDDLGLAVVPRHVEMRSALIEIMDDAFLRSKPVNLRRHARSKRH